MAHAVIRAEGTYFLWSTVVDAPITEAMSRDKMREHLLWRYGHSEEAAIDQGLARADETGTSSLYGLNIEEIKKYNRAGPKEGRLSWSGILKLVRARKRKAA